jgi:hypothetical protein
MASYDFKAIGFSFSRSLNGRTPGVREAKEFKNISVTKITGRKSSSG